MVSAETIRRATEILGERLRQTGHVWVASVGWRDRDDVEFTLRGGPTAVSFPHLHHATMCLAALDDLVVDCERVLATVPEEDALFPPKMQRQWRLEGLDFSGADAERGKAHFTLMEADGKWDYVYVSFVVSISDGRAQDAWAEVT